MSSTTRNIGKRIKEKRNRMYMDNMYELFNLSLFHLLSLRSKYLRHMRKREREKKRLAKAIKKEYGFAKV